MIRQLQRARKRIRTARVLGLIAICVIAVLAHDAGADTINVKASVRLAGDATEVRLADIATLDGADAESLGDVVVASFDSNEELIEVPISRVRSKLDAAGAHWGRINLNGRSVVVRRRMPTGAPMRAMQSASINEGNDESPDRSERDVSINAETLVGQSSLMSSIAKLFAEKLGVDPADLRLNMTDADRRMLEAADVDSNVNADADATRRFEIELTSSAHSEQVRARVFTWINGRRDTRPMQITVRPEARSDVPIAEHRIVRNQVLSESDIRFERQWLSPDQALLIANPDAIVGRTTARAFEAGDVLHSRHLRSPIVVRRGDVVSVRCLVGGVSIAMQAEARDSASLGESIMFRKIGERETFHALVTGKGEAIVDLGKR